MNSSQPPYHLINDVNIIYERFVFGSAIQEENETNLNFIARLKHLSINCGYESMTDDLVRDRLILGIRDDELRKIFLRNKFLTLQQAVAVCKSIESNLNCHDAIQVKTEPDLEIYDSNPISVCESLDTISSNDQEMIQVKIEPYSEVYESLSPNTVIPNDEIKEESCSPVHQEYIHAETIELVTDDDEDMEKPIGEELDISFLNDVRTYAMLKDVPKYSCNICDATFFELRELTVHLRECKRKNI